MNKYTITFSAVLSLICFNLTAAEFKFEFLKAGEVLPEGWIREQMRLDLEHGLTGQYHKVSNAVNLKVFEKQNRPAGEMVEIPGEEKDQKSWWSGEHEGYWKDSIVRMAFLLKDKEQVQRVDEWMSALIKHQGDDGYIGIYSPETRFPTEGENGELWTQSRIFQAMLAYYEFTGDLEILNAVEKAVKLTLSKYMGTTYFGTSNIQGGVSHAVGYMDTLEWLYRLTEHRAYRDGAVWLYEDFQNMKERELELQVVNLLKLNLPWTEHTPHIMEGLHMPAIVSALTGEQKYRTAYKNALIKFDRHCNPGGGVVGDEKVKGREGSADMPNEYCTITEGVSSLNRILAWQGDLSAGSRVERVCLNAAQGARFQPVNKAVRYLTSDNQKTADIHKHGRRYLYSAWHDAAACCTLNAGRLLPYYVEGMWFKDTKAGTLLANLYGPCVVNTEISGTEVEIVEQTEFPFSDKVMFHVNASSPVKFTLSLRLPAGSGKPTVNADRDSDIKYKNDRIEVTRLWKKGDMIEVDFNFGVKRVNDRNGEFYHMWGPLVFSLPLGENRKAIREFDALGGVPSGFHMWEIRPSNLEYWNFTLGTESEFTPVNLPNASIKLPWANPPIGLKGSLYDAEGKLISVTLRPMGTSLLRRTTFPYTKK